MSYVPPFFVIFYFRLIAVLTAIIGVSLIVWPEVVTLFFASIDPAATFFVRIVGSTLFGYAVLNGITAYYAKGSLAYKLCASANLTTLSIALLVCIIFRGKIDSNAGLLIVQHLIFAVGFLYCLALLKKPPLDPALVGLRPLVRRHVDSHKYDYGHVLVIGGSAGMVGAPLLTGQAALRIGAGLVTIASPAAVAGKLEERVAEIMTLALADDSAAASRELLKFIKARKVSTAVIGPGMRPALALPLLKSLLKITALPIVIDGGALAALSAKLNLLSERSDNSVVLTPHLGEFRRLLDTPGSDIPQQAATLATKYNLTMVLKGHPTRIYDSAESYENHTGGPALATAGSGDVLAGMIGGLIAQGVTPYEAAKAAVYLHGLAGNLAAEAKTEAGVIASDIIESIPPALKSLEA
jgi:hydroxyethylthiazole kinase-like uncharacterized protein yjeF